MDSINDVPVLIRREIEARLATPLIRAFAREFGEERTYAIVREVVASAARAAGGAMKEAVGGNTLGHLKAGLAAMNSGDSLRSEFTQSTPACLKMNVTSCKYADMYRSLGLEDLGSMLSCERDASLFEGFNSSIRFTRTKTILNGEDCCDFCMRLQNEE